MYLTFNISVVWHDVMDTSDSRKNGLSVLPAQSLRPTCSFLSCKAVSVAVQHYITLTPPLLLLHEIIKTVV